MGDHLDPIEHLLRQHAPGAGRPQPVQMGDGEHDPAGGLVEHHHSERNHQGLGNRLITVAAVPETPANANARIGCRERLGGLLNFYYRRTA